MKPRHLPLEELVEWEWLLLCGRTHDQAHAMGHTHNHAELEADPGVVKIRCGECLASVVLERRPTTSRGNVIGGKTLLETPCDPQAARERWRTQAFEAMMMELEATNAQQ